MDLWCVLFFLLFSSIVAFTSSPWLVLLHLLLQVHIDRCKGAQNGPQKGRTLFWKTSGGFGCSAFVRMAGRLAWQWFFCSKIYLPAELSPLRLLLPLSAIGRKFLHRSAVCLLCFICCYSKLFAWVYVCLFPPPMVFHMQCSLGSLLAA